METNSDLHVSVDCLSCRPLVAMQSLDNTRDVMVCRNCLGFVGSLVSQVSIVDTIPAIITTRFLYVGYRVVL